MLLDKLGATDKVLHPQIARSQWAHNRQVLADVFATKTRQEWCNTLGGSDVCFAPVLSMTEAQGHPHNVARGTFVEIDGVKQVAAAPRFSRTPAAIQSSPQQISEDPGNILKEWGVAIRNDG